MVLGTYKEAISARATDKRVQDVSQDGGIVSALFMYALEEGIIEGAVVAGNTDEKWRPQPVVAMDAEEIIAAAGTKYTMSPNIAAVKEAVRQCGVEKLGIVGTPCQINGLRKMQVYPFSSRFIADKVKLVLGIFCMENFPYASLDTFIDAQLNSTMDETKKMDIGKGKFWAISDKGEEGLPLKKTHGYEQAGCNICSDYVAEYSDLSTGSVGSPDGWSTVLLRTDDGNSIFKAAVDAGVIETKNMDDVKPGLPLLEKLAKGKKADAKKEIDNRTSMGLPVPNIY
ncbi:coenzyme F420 hydrogenase subunit beta [Methanobrevibacter sp. DSM 116169]|uniref:coenzyme F420 hydrogenase subunit beta n=1 Tax=Methanobrevibacter sp. DSM 116169 TaxID=3242727 RepID=UPI0038FC173C